MFTGIIEEMGQVVALTQPTDRDARLVISAPIAADSKSGASVAINGVCLTVLDDAETASFMLAAGADATSNVETPAVERPRGIPREVETKGQSDARLLAFDVMPQTLKLTGLGELQPGDAVNVERAMLATSRFDGHVVQGHVDGRATLVSRQPGERWDTLRFALKPELLQFLAPQGSITVDGVSLTVSDLHDDGFSVSLIPTTLAVTTLGKLQPGAQVNIETDVLAKQLARLGVVNKNFITAQPGDEVTEVAVANQPTQWGNFRIHAFRDSAGNEHVALVNLRSATENPSAPLVRVHSECLTGDAFGSLRCDCGPQLHAAMQLVARDGGAVLYLRGQEGRGIGLAAKIAAYALQDQGLDTVEANEQLGLPVDARDYSAAVAMLNKLGLTNIRLLTNNPAKVDALKSHGINVEERVPIEVGVNPINEFYLETKRDRMHHQLHLKES